MQSAHRSRREHLTLWSSSTRRSQPAPHRDVVVASDGYSLVTHRYGVSSPRACLIVAGAVGTPQSFYRRFAQFAQARGFETTLFDYRGIGDSAPPTLRDMRMDLRDWGRRDLAAVIERVGETADRECIPLYLMAHSFGGHAFGLTPNHARVRACYAFGTGAGWHGWMPAGERLRVWALWNVVGPMLTRWKGHLAWSLFGMGEDLPPGVFDQWRQWCRYRHYFFDDPEIGAEMRAMFAQVRTPIAAAAATDDRWSPPASRDAFMSGYVNAAVERIDVHPSAVGLSALGHLGFFRSSAQTLWGEALDWFQRHDD